MPDKTADALARILSLSGPSTSESARPNEEVQPWQPAPGPVERSPTPGDHGGESNMLSSMFYELAEESSSSNAAGDRRPRLGSGMSWTDSSGNSPQSDENEGQEEAGAVEECFDEPFNAHGPESYGSFHRDPFGPGDEACSVKAKGVPRDSRTVSREAARPAPSPALQPFLQRCSMCTLVFQKLFSSCSSIGLLSTANNFVMLRAARSDSNERTHTQTAERNSATGSSA
jgi:hypothetical protein